MADELAPDLKSPLPEPAKASDTYSLPDEAFEGAVAHDPTAHLKAKNAHYSSAWIKGPGAVELLAEAGRDLFMVSALRGAIVTEIAFVHLLALPAVRALLLWPSNEKDLEAVQVVWRDGAAFFTASSVLRAAKIPVESGHRNRYQVQVTQSAKSGHALMVDMRYELESKVLPKRNRRAKAKEEPQE
jgi:hypothetical protein